MSINPNYDSNRNGTQILISFQSYLIHFVTDLRRLVIFCGVNDFTEIHERCSAF